MEKAKNSKELRFLSLPETSNKFVSMNREVRLKKRNEAVRDFFERTVEKNPQWRIESIIEVVADKFYLATRTIEAILKSEGNYK